MKTTFRFENDTKINGKITDIDARYSLYLLMNIN